MVRQYTGAGGATVRGEACAPNAGELTPEEKEAGLGKGSRPTKQQVAEEELGGACTRAEWTTRQPSSRVTLKPVRSVAPLTRAPTAAWPPWAQTATGWPLVCVL